jgi:putative FmdB family regulatory protein
MPIYEYHCLSCDTTHEVWQKISDQPKTLCPECGGS